MKNEILDGPSVKASGVLEKKIINFQHIIRRTMLSAQRYKILDIFGATEFNMCIQNLENIFDQLTILLYPIQKKQIFDENQIISKLQEINNELSVLFRTFGTHSIEDLISICFGSNYITTYLNNDNLLAKYELIREYVHPIGYKVMSWQTNSQPKTDTEPLQKNRIIEDFMIVEGAQNFDCFDLARTSKSFQTKVYGVKIAILNVEQRKTLIVCGIVDEIMLGCLNYRYIDSALYSLSKNKPKDDDFSNDSFKRFIACLTLKEILIYNNEGLYNRYMGSINQVYLIKQKTISQTVKEFLGNELYGQRTILIQLLLKAHEPEFQYLAYLLYDLLSNDTQGNVDTHEQTLLFDSLPWNVKKYFRDAMKQTIQYTNNLSNFDSNNIPLEQQICLIKANDIVKEKAMLKLKEVKAKSEDSGAKARQYLEGLLRIPFGIYREEPILKIMPEIISAFSELVTQLNRTRFPITLFPIKTTYNSLEVSKYMKILTDHYLNTLNYNTVDILKKKLMEGKRQNLVENICMLNMIIKKNTFKRPKLCHSGKTTSYMREHIKEFIDEIISNQCLLSTVASACNIYQGKNNILTKIEHSLSTITKKNTEISEYITGINNTLNTAIHGHEKAKRQIERIIGQWINGEPTGHCLGFEGPPGIGKTSLAKKGIAQCLKDAEGGPRPFAFIAIGGSSNGSTLEGHNYTYVGSTWGRIVEILQERSCMNPIIFIDELDKVSGTEHGREIIGILTHLVDPTQNDAFQDKYFNGIDLDLSRILFIFSYNDKSVIDRILLDRIHRIKFDHLSLADKLIIAEKYILPEIYKTMGLVDVIEFSSEVIEYIVETYTSESGVRKLKELLFEIIGEINLLILKGDLGFSLPVVLTKDDIQYNYLKDRTSIKPQMIHSVAKVGIINGLWANVIGRGGILPIEVKYYPTNTFLDLKLTGMQGDVMKESMKVAITLAWSLLEKEEMKILVKSFEEIKLQGMHIHVPEGSTPKEGPSAGTAITVALYSLLTNKKIKNTVAITGEICLQGNVTAIGGLDLKILGGIRANVKEFIFPKENDKDFQEFKDKYKESNILDNITFHSVETIGEVLELVFE